MIFKPTEERIASVNNLKADYALRIVIDVKSFHKRNAREI